LNTDDADNADFYYVIADSFRNPLKNKEIVGQARNDVRENPCYPRHLRSIKTQTSK